MSDLFCDKAQAGETLHSAEFLLILLSVVAGDEFRLRARVGRPQTS